jgi:hypothetical protein
MLWGKHIGANFLAFTSKNKEFVIGDLLFEKGVVLFENIEPLVNALGKVRKCDSPMKQMSCTPRQVAVGISLTRSKKCIDILHGYGYSIHYNQILRLETQMANSVLANISSNGGVFIRRTTS